MPSQEEIDRLDSLLNPRPAANTNLLNATGSPDEAARTLSNSVATGTPFSVGNMNPKEFNAEVETNKAIATSNNDPVVARYLGSNDFAAHVSRDDTDALASISPLLKPFMRFEKGLFKSFVDAAQEDFQMPYFTDEQRQQYPLFTKMWGPWVQAFETGQRLVGAGFSGIGGAAEYVGQQLGMSQGDARRLGRDLYTGAQMAGVVTPEAITAGRVSQHLQPVQQAMDITLNDIRHHITSGEVPLPGVSAQSDAFLIREAKQDNEQFQDALKAVKKSATLERSPDAFKAFVDEAVQGKEVSIPADAVMEVLGDKAPEQFAWLPDFEEQMRVAGTTGGDIKIPLSDWLSHGVELADAFKEDIRLRPEGLTLHEAEELEKTKPESYESRSPKFNVLWNAEKTQFEAISAEGKTIGHLVDAFPEGKGPAFTAGAKVDEDMRRQGVATALYDKFAARHGDNIVPAGNTTPDAWEFWLARYPDKVIETLRTEASKIVSDIKSGDFPKSYADDAVKGYSHPRIQELLKDAINAALSNKEWKPEISHKPVIKSVNPAEIDFRSASAAATNESWLNPLFKDYGLEAQPTEGAKPLFTGPQDLGMPKPMWNQYQKKIQDLRDKQDEAAIKYAKKEIAKRQTAEWKAEESRQRDQLTTDLRYRPDIMADTFLRTGMLGTEKRPRFQLDAELIEKKYGKEVADGLPKGSAIKRGGVDPSDVAAVFGFHSGDALVNNLYLLENKRKFEGQSPAQHFKATVDRQLSQVMDKYAKAHGTLEDNIMKEAREAVGSGGQADLLADEMFALQKNWDETQRSITREQTEAQIKEDFNKLSWRDAMRSTDFDRAAGKAGRQTEMALLKGDIQTAFQAKQRQFISVLMAREARALEKQVRQGEKLFNTHAKNPTLPGVEQEYKDRIDQILDGLQYGVRRPPDELRRATEKQSLEQFVKDKIDEGNEVYVAQSLLDPMSAGRTMRNFNYDAINVNDWRDLYDSVKSLDTNGRDARKITIAGQIMDLDLKVQEAVSGLEGLPTRPTLDPKTFRGAARKLKVLQIRPEVIALWADRLDPNGVFSKVFQGISEAYGKKLDMDKETAADLKALPRGVTFKGLDEGVENTIGLKNPLNDQELVLKKTNILGMALHMGTKSNWEQVTKGWRVDPADLSQFIFDNMTKEDMDWVQGVWNILNKRFPEAEAVHRRVSGVGVKKIERQTVHTPWGDYDGGYIRLKPDPLANDMAEFGKMGVFGEANWSSPAPGASFMKERTGKLYAPVIDAHDIVPALRETNHYIAMREVLRDALKFYEHPDIRKTVRNKMGQEYSDSFRPYIEDIAADGSGSKLENEKAWQTLHNMAGGLRRNWTIAELGYRISTAEKHGMGALSNSIIQIGPDNFAQGLKDVLTPGSKVHDQILAESSMMRNRMQTMDRDMMDALRKAYGENTLWATGVHHAFSLVGALDYMSAVPTYQGGKLKALKENPFLTDREAVAAGEQAVRLAHGGGTVVDLPALLRSRNQIVRLSLVAMTFWNATFNKLAMALKEGQEGIRNLRGMDYGAKQASLSKAAARGVMTIVGLALAEQLIDPQKLDEDESWGVSAAKIFGRPVLASIPWGREAATWIYHSAKNRRLETPKITPAFDLAVSTAQTLINATQVVKGEDVKDARAIRDLVESTTVGGAFRVPGAGQAGMAAQYFWNVNEGKDKMESPWDVWKGLTTGKAEEKPRRR